MLIEIEYRVISTSENNYRKKAIEKLWRPTLSEDCTTGKHPNYSIKIFMELGGIEGAGEMKQRGKVMEFYFNQNAVKYNKIKN